MNCCLLFGDYLLVGCGLGEVDLLSGVLTLGCSLFALRIVFALFRGCCLFGFGLKLDFGFGVYLFAGTFGVLVSMFFCDFRGFYLRVMFGFLLLLRWFCCCRVIALRVLCLMFWDACIGYWLLFVSL